MYLDLYEDAVITTDQGSEIKNQLNDEMMKILNIRHHLITAYHPQVDKIKRVGEVVRRISVEKKQFRLVEIN